MDFFLSEIVPLLPLISRVKVDQKEALLLGVFFFLFQSPAARNGRGKFRFIFLVENLKGKSSAPLLATSVVAIVISAGEREKIWSCGWNATRLLVYRILNVSAASKKNRLLRNIVVKY